MDSALQVAKNNNISAMCAHVQASKELAAADLANGAAHLGSSYARCLYTRIALAGAIAATAAALAEWNATDATLCALQKGGAQ